MNWKQEAAERLRTYALRKHALTALPQQIREAQLYRESIQAARTDGAAVSGGTCQQDRLLGSLVYQEELERRLAATEVYVSGIEAALQALTEEERLVLDRFYIHPQRGNADKLCEELCVERASVYRRKDQALRRFTMALYGWEEV